MPSNINTSLEPTKSLVNFRFWCQKVLPLVYDDSLSYYEVLGKMVVQLNDVIDDVNADIENVDTLKEAFLALQTYVNEFFDDIDQLASYTERAESAQTAANQSAINAASSASNASASSLAAMNARDAAVTARQAAEASASTASAAVTNANTKASEAAQSATAAQTAQENASQSATSASGSALNASTSASAAQQSFTLADAARAAAQSAAEKAEEAAQSIPSDYSNLVASVNENIVTSIQLTGNITNQINYPLIKGHLYKILNETSSTISLNGIKDESTTRIFTSLDPNRDYWICSPIDYDSLTAYANQSGTLEITDFCLTEKLYTFSDLNIIETHDSQFVPKPLSKNDFIMWNGSLWKVRTPIAEGGAISPNTNAVPTTISAELTLILNALNL